MKLRSFIGVSTLFVTMVVSIFNFGCAGRHNTRLRADLVERASFDLDCSEHNVDLRELSRSGGIINSYGVTGCGKRATYVLDMAGNGTWVMNSGGENPQ